MIDPTIIGRRIRDEREWLGFTQAQLARAAKFTVFEIADLEDGARAPTDDETARLARLFGLDSAERLRGEPLAEDPGLVSLLRRKQLPHDDCYEVHRFAEFLRNAGPAPKIPPETRGETR